VRPRHLRAVAPPPLDVTRVLAKELPPADLDALLRSITSWSQTADGGCLLNVTDMGPWFAALPRWTELHCAPDIDGA